MKLIVWITARILALKAILASRGKRRPEGKPGARAPSADGIEVPLAGRGTSGSPGGRPTTAARTGSLAAAAPTRGASGGVDQAPDSPMDLSPTDWKATAKRTIEEVKDDRITLAAAGMAYYFFLAIFPAVIAAIGIFGLINVDEGGMVDAIRRNMPGGSGAVLVDAVRNAERPAEGAKIAAAIFGVAAALWSASSGMVALQSGLNIAYDVRTDRKFVGKRLVAFALLFATGVLGGVPSPFFTFGDGLIFSLLGWILTLAAVIVLFSLFYYLGPNRDRPTWKWVSAGGLLGAGLWVVSSLGFGFYASNFSTYGKTYGPLAGVIILIFWLYLSSLSVLVGGELNSELERQARRSEA